MLFSAFVFHFLCSLEIDMWQPSVNELDSDVWDLVAVNGITCYKCSRHENTKPSVITNRQQSEPVYSYTSDFESSVILWVVDLLNQFEFNTRKSGNKWDEQLDKKKKQTKTTERHSIMSLLQNPFKEQSKVKIFIFFDFVKSSVNKNGLSFFCAFCI